MAGAAPCPLGRKSHESIVTKTAYLTDQADNYWLTSMTIQEFSAQLRLIRSKMPRVTTMRVDAQMGHLGGRAPSTAQRVNQLAAAPERVRPGQSDDD